MENKRLRIDSAGFIYLENKISAKLSCNMHFERFPMDVQVKNSLNELENQNGTHVTWNVPRIDEFI